MGRYRPPPPPKSSYITPDGALRLRAEAEELWTVERPRVTQQVSEAAAQGDRSENAEYIYGKKRLREIDARLRYLTKRLDVLNVVTEVPVNNGKVFFGAWVRLEDEEGDQVEYRVVGPDEFDATQGLISMDSPMGRALLGKEDGDEVTVRRPGGAKVYEIVKVWYQKKGK